MSYILVLFLVGLLMLLGLVTIQLLRIEKLIVGLAERVEEEVVSKIG